MPQFRSLSQLGGYINDLAKKSIKEDVAPAVKQRMQENIETMVYSYEPKRYERTGQLKEDIDIRDVEDGVVIVPTRTDEETGKYIPSVIESGVGYNYTGYGYEYEKPRPFVSQTRNDFQDSGEHIQLLKQGLKKNGLDVT